MITLDQSSPIQTWEINGETFMSVPFARYICSFKCCKTVFSLRKKIKIVDDDLVEIIEIFRNKYYDQVISECSPTPNAVAPHCLLSSDSTSPYFVPWDPNPKSSTCEGYCP